jgi:hypothetical protein
MAATAFSVVAYHGGAVVPRDPRVIRHGYRLLVPRQPRGHRSSRRRQLSSKLAWVGRREKMLKFFLKMSIFMKNTSGNIFKKC